MDGVWVVVFGTVYKPIENYVLHPRITSKTVSPAVAIRSVIAGASLFGAMGALASVPVVAVIRALFETYGRRFELVAETSASAPAPDVDGDSTSARD